MDWKMNYIRAKEGRLSSHFWRTDLDFGWAF